MGELVASISEPLCPDRSAWVMLHGAGKGAGRRAHVISCSSWSATTHRKNEQEEVTYAGNDECNILVRVKVANGRVQSGGEGVFK